MESIEEKNLSRRGLIVAGAVAAACACCCGEAAAAPGDGGPGSAPGGPGGGNRLPPEDPKAPQQIDIGDMKDFAKDGVTEKWSKGNTRFLVIRDSGKLYAASSICTHKGCVLKMKEAVITCPCHQSTFTNDGVPASGKATVSLFRYGVSLDDKKHIIVDKAKQFEEKKWDDDGASLKVS